MLKSRNSHWSKINDFLKMGRTVESLGCSTSLRTRQSNLLHLHPLDTFVTTSWVIQQNRENDWIRTLSQDKWISCFEQNFTLQGFTSICISFKCLGYLAMCIRLLAIQWQSPTSFLSTWYLRYIVKQNKRL